MVEQIQRDWNDGRVEGCTSALLWTASRHRVKPTASRNARGTYARRLEVAIEGLNRVKGLAKVRFKGVAMAPGREHRKRMVCKRQRCCNLVAALRAHTGA